VAGEKPTASADEFAEASQSSRREILVRNL
jgi:hypothetical protein